MQLVGFSGPPVISTFSVSPANVYVGQGPETLAYNVSNATFCSISPGIGVIPVTGNGSGQISVNPTATTTYTLTVSNFLQQVASAQTTVTVLPLPPGAYFSGGPTNRTIPLQVTFTNSSNISWTNSIWYFGDGSSVTSSAASVTHTYNSVGSYTVELIVQGSAGSATNTVGNYITASSPPYLDSPFLKTLVTTTPNGVVIAYGTNASSLTAANIILGAIQRIPGYSTWRNMMPAATFDGQNFTNTGQTHVIAVGTLADNVVLQGRTWLPTWWMDWGWYATSFPLGMPQSELGLAYQPTNGFMAAGFGYWPAGTQGVGLVEVDRSHLFCEWVVRSRMNQVAGMSLPGTGNDVRAGMANVVNNLPNAGAVGDAASFTSVYPVYPKNFPLRLIVRITGSGEAGVMAAATAFANQQMVNGVVLASGTTAGMGPPQATLSTNRYATQLPFTPPASAPGGSTYVGWLLPDAFEYDGLLYDAGVSPVQMFRVKYMPASGITSFWTTPQRRAGEFEIACLKFATAAAATQAASAINSAVENLQPYKLGSINNWGVAVNGPDVYLRSMVGSDGAQLLSAFASLPQW